MKYWSYRYALVLWCFAWETLAKRVTESSLAFQVDAKVAAKVGEKSLAQQAVEVQPVPVNTAVGSDWFDLNLADLIGLYTSTPKQEPVQLKRGAPTTDLPATKPTSASTLMDMMRPQLQATVKKKQSVYSFPKGGCRIFRWGEVGRQARALCQGLKRDNWKCDVMTMNQYGTAPLDMNVDNYLCPQPVYCSCTKLKNPKTGKDFTGIYYNEDCTSFKVNHTAYMSNIKDALCTGWEDACKKRCVAKKKGKNKACNAKCKPEWCSDQFPAYQLIISRPYSDPTKQSTAGASMGCWNVLGPKWHYEDKSNYTLDDYAKIVDERDGGELFKRLAEYAGYVLFG